MHQSELPQKDYPLATVVYREPLTLEDLIAFGVELFLVYAPFLKFALRVVLVYVWVYLLVSLIMGKLV